MHVTRGFLISAPLGFLAAAGVYLGAVYAQLGSPTHLSHWCGEIMEKKLVAAERVTGPKLVVLGGSSTFFGIKAAELQRELDVPTINGGTHAALGMAYLLESGKRLLKPGDTALVVPEYEVLDYGEDNRATWASTMYVDFILARDPDYFRGLGLIDQWEISLMTPLKRLGKGLANRVKPEPPIRFRKFHAYDPAWVNEYGDMTGHTANRRPAVCAARDEAVCLPLVNGLPGDAQGLPLLADFCKWAKKRGIRVLITFPSMVDRPEYRGDAAAGLESRVRGFCDSLGVPVVGALTDPFMPAERFFDTQYHPTEEAALERTARLAEALRPWFAGEGSNSSPEN